MTALILDRQPAVVACQGPRSKAARSGLYDVLSERGFLGARTVWVFGECETFKKFKQRDVDRMQLIADSFPDAILAVATLAEGFSDEKKALLLPFVEACRAYGKLDRPRHGVLLLTG